MKWYFVISVAASSYGLKLLLPIVLIPKEKSKEKQEEKSE